MANVNSTKYGVLAADGMVKIGYKVTHSSFPVSQGDLVYLDAGIVKRVASDANAATLAGIALEPSIVSSNVDNTGAPAEKAIQVGSMVVAAMKTTAAETYAENDLVYATADAQTITNVAGGATSPVGRVKLPSNVASVTGATGVTVDCIIFSRATVMLAN